MGTVYIVGRPSQTSGDPRLSFLLCSENGTELRALPLSPPARARASPAPRVLAQSPSGSTGPPTRWMSDSFTFSALKRSAARVSFSSVASNSSGAPPGFTKRR